MKKTILFGLVLMMSLAACGESEREKEKDGEGMRGEQACLTTPAPIADPRFPAGFPEIGDVTFTGSQDAGPSKVITGYTGDALEDLYREMKEKFGEGSYSVTKAEQDPHDFEVNFSGNESTGQVRVSEECQGRRAVTITIRPAA